MISVIYCTARYGGLDILQKCMLDQTYQDFEVIVLDELRRMPADMGKFKFIDPPKKKPGMFWNLSASLNAGIRAAEGDLIVLLQDYIWVPKDGLARFNQKAAEEIPCLISGVGHQYSEPSRVDDKWSHHSVWLEWPGIPSGERVFDDPRLRRPGFYLCNPVEWEANWSCFHKSIWQVVGGFDEDFDAGWGYDNVNFAERCQLAGFNTFLDTQNEVLCYSHINLFGEKEHRDKSPNNQELWHRKYRDLHKGSKQWKLAYA